MSLPPYCGGLQQRLGRMHKLAGIPLLNPNVSPWNAHPLLVYLKSFCKEPPLLSWLNLNVTLPHYCSKDRSGKYVLLHLSTSISIT